MNKPDIHQFISFFQLLLQFREVERRTRIPAHPDEHENDAEHSYLLSMMSWYLSTHFPHLDSNLVIKIALTHDLVETYAGDTFPYDQDHVATKKARESKALERLTRDWPDFPAMLESIQQYEDRESKEAKFVYAVDKILPTIIHFLGEGRGWHEYNFSLDDIVAEKTTKADISPEVSEYYAQLLELLKENLHLFPNSTNPNS